MRKLRSWVPLALASLLVAACGGGGSDGSTRVQITSVKVMGDSLADSGTFGFKFTVQGAQSFIYPERIATNYSVSTLCPFYLFNGTTFVANPTAGCTNYAIGGGRINNYTAPTAPLSIPQQLATAGSVAGTYKSTDLLVIDGGGNDAADLVGAYLRVPSDSGAAYSALLQTVLPSATVQAALAQGAAGFASIGGTYMTALADVFYNAIKANALDKGAQHVVVLNMPGITNTPRFQMVLDSIAAANGGGTAGATARASAEGLFNSWISAFNSELAAKFNGNSNVALVDFYTSFNDQIASPAQYLLTNVKTPACPPTGTGSDGLLTYNFSTCTDAALSATTPPAGSDGTANWWKSYAFSDSFHPTPYGHDLLARRIMKSLADAGWY
ncbi:MAG TPA: SGNH/GDSL hydrolase family protein [Burkholderiaceae bacterium]|nr:SGNH/GDSL hydrolase family protein [Burkholderiaceae bacterium]